MEKSNFCRFIRLHGTLQVVWEPSRLSRNPAGCMRIPPCRLCGNPAGCVRTLQVVWEPCRLYENSAGSVGTLQALWEPCRLCGNPADSIWIHILETPVDLEIDAQIYRQFRSEKMIYSQTRALNKLQLWIFYTLQ